jgi:uncharacterized membrane protein
MKILPSYYHAVALAGFFGLFILSMLWYTVLAPPTSIPVALILLLTVTPLLLPMRGLLNGKLKSCSWAAYVSLLYFIHGSIETYSNPSERLYASLEVIFSLMLFLGAVGYVRGVKKSQQ